MGFQVTTRAFRFEHAGKEYALDVFNEGIVIGEPAVHLFYMTANDGWHRVHMEMEPALIVYQSTIDEHGGVVKLCEFIVEKINKALRLLHGAAEGGDIPEGMEPHEVVADYLRTHLTLAVVNGAPQLVLSD